MNERRAEHDQLRNSMARFAAMMGSDGEIDHAGLLRERMLFAQLFNAHLAREQEEVDQAAAAQTSTTTISRCRSEMIGRLRADCSKHVRRWIPTLIRSDWQAYRDAVLALQRRLVAFMDWEERNLSIYA